MTLKRQAGIKEVRLVVIRVATLIHLAESGICSLQLLES
jgi:hypothetical protein